MRKTICPSSIANKKQLKTPLIQILIFLSLGLGWGLGRMTLIRSEMDSLPTYMMSLFPIAKVTEKKINKLRKGFLWQGNKEKKL